MLCRVCLSLDLSLHRGLSHVQGGSHTCRGQVLRLMLVFNRLFFDQLVGTEQNDTLDSLNQVQLIDIEEMNLLKVTPSAAHVVWRWLSEAFSDHSIGGHFLASHPIQSRSYQVSLQRCQSRCQSVHVLPGNE